MYYEVLDIATRTNLQLFNDSDQETCLSRSSINEDNESFLDNQSLDTSSNIMNRPVNVLNRRQTLDPNGTHTLRNYVSHRKDTIVQRVKDGIYKAPSRTGVSYMLCPLSRTHRDDGFVNEVMPHYMFYAPGVNDNDIGGKWEGGDSYPFAVNSGDVLDKKHSIFNLIILPVGEMEKAKIIEENKDLLERLATYKSYFKIETNTTMQEHQH